jgi:hypothetical protein
MERAARMKDGEVVPGIPPVRWCSGCNRHHGVLYICEHYPEDIKVMLREEGEQFRKNVHDPAWIQRQIDNGASPQAVAIMQVFAGPRRH